MKFFTLIIGGLLYSSESLRIHPSQNHDQSGLTSMISQSAADNIFLNYDVNKDKYLDSK